MLVVCPILVRLMVAMGVAKREEGVLVSQKRIQFVEHFPYQTDRDSGICHVYPCSDACINRGKVQRGN